MKSEFQFNLAVKVLLCLIALYFTIDYVSTIAAQRIIVIYGTEFMAASFIYPFSYNITDVITEVYGYKVSLFTIALIIVGAFLFLVLGEGVNAMQSPPHWAYNAHYAVIINEFSRLYFTGCIGFLVGMLFNTFILAKLKLALKGRFFFARALVSSAIGIFIHTTIGDFLAFFGTMSVGQIMRITVVNNMTNIIFILLGSLIITPFVYYLKNKLKIDPYEHIGNPFK